MEAYRSYNFHQIYQKLHNFCANDLGGFYLDVIKDRQYTTQADSVARRSAQTAMYHIGEALVRWIAPILSFTAEEIWENLPGERAPSVLLQQWYQGLHSLSPDEAMGRTFWQQLMAVRAAVNKAMETQRAAGVLRGSLDAAVTLYCSADLHEILRALGDELRFVLITSAATLLPLECCRQQTRRPLNCLSCDSRLQWRPKRSASAAGTAVPMLAAVSCIRHCAAAV